MARILQSKNHVSFVIVGDGHLRRQLWKQARDLEISHKVHFVDSVNNVIPYLQLMGVGVITSEPEGFSNSILEYIASGLPVACFDSGGNGELITNNANGFVGKPNSVVF